ncbi:unnamed protein product [Symbiodinium pilosum]|uniref:Uncharacterized protein n=1 Tax=Symbiodinium pilosum TaxID=2952 RepID=A0A812KRB0_SYMPI|nr:unnamed protein product [Symbiodinium pilosum]
MAADLPRNECLVKALDLWESQVEDLHLDFLPPGPTGVVVATIMVAIGLCFVVGVGTWTYAVRTRTEKLPVHVAYLIGPYKSDCAAWEVERLVRKMLLALVTAVLPISLSPAIQMTGVLLILLASLALYCEFRPYEDDSRNRLEAALLFVGLAMTSMTTCLVANDLHWASSAVTQETLIFIICFLAAGVTLTMMAFIARAFYTERYGAA